MSLRRTATYILKRGHVNVGDMVTADQLGRRKTRFRDWKGRHGDRRMRACLRELRRAVWDLFEWPPASARASAARRS